MTSLRDKKDRPSRPIPEAQADELRLRWQASQAASDLKPGDLVKEKRGLGYLRRVKEGGPDALILWRMLDEENIQDFILIEDFLQEMGAFAPLDCIIGFITDGGNAVKLMPHSTQYLEPAGGPDDAV